MAYPGGYPGSQPGAGYPGSQPGAGYPGSQSGGYPGGGYPGAQPAGYPGGGYPGGQQPQGYPGSGGYGGPPQQSQAQQWFSAVDSDKSGRISAEELQAALINSNGEKFSMEACRLMIHMFDPNRTGTIDVQGFEHLFNYMNQWLAAFRNYDSNRSGTIDRNELMQAFQQMGYRFSPQFVDGVIAKYDPMRKTQLSTDQFILACITIQRMTDAFRSRDREMKGVVTFQYEDFLQVVFTNMA